MASQLLNIRNSYKFPEYIDVQNIPDTRSIEYGIKKVLCEEFGIVGEVECIETVSYTHLTLPTICSV